MSQSVAIDVNTILKKINSALIQGSFDEALEYIVETELANKLGESEKQILIIYKLHGYLGIAEYNQVIKLSENIIDQKITSKNFRIIFLANIYYADALRHLQSYEQAMNIFKKISSLISKYSGMLHVEWQDLRAKYIGGNAKLCHSMGDLTKSIELFEQAKEIYKQANDRIQIQQTMVDLAYVFRENNEREKANKLCMQALAIKNIEESSRTVSKCLYLLGLISEDNTKYQIALSYFKQSLDISELRGLRLDLAQTLHSIGRIQQELGLFSESLKAFNESYKIFLDLKNIYEMSKLQHSLGELYLKLGNINQSLRNFKDSLLLSKELNNFQFIARENFSLSKIYLIKNDLHKSKEYIEINIKNTIYLNDVSNGNSFFQLGVLNYIQNDCDLALEYFKKSQLYFFKLRDKRYYINVILFKLMSYDEIKDYESLHNEIKYLENTIKINFDPKLELLVKIARDIVNKNSFRLKDKSITLKNFKTYINDSSIDIRFREYCILQELKLLLFEYNLYLNQVSLEDINNLIEKLKKFSQKNYQIRLKVYTCMLQSKLALIKNNIDNAIEFIEEAFLASQSHSFTNLEEKLKIEYEELTEKVSYWKNYFKRKKINKKIIGDVGLDILIDEIIAEKIIFFN